jgi:peptide chain release factor 1
VIVEIRAGAGGEESALFAGVLFRMYSMYAESRGWKPEVVYANETGLGGFKEISFMINGEGAYSRFKFESGVHRVQRIPVTESNGKIQTSTVTVAVLPEAEDVDVQLNPADLQIDTFRSSGAGGQHVNKTDSAIRITHIPTGIVVQCQNDRSQHKNKATAMKILKSRLYEFELQKKQEESSELEKQKTGIDFGSQIRSYVLHPYKMVKDHRTDFETGNADAVLDGEPILDKFMEDYLLKEGESNENN